MTTTLICWCRNDDEVTDAARNFQADYRYSGCRLAGLKQTLERLGEDDVLVITAHGTPHAIGAEGDEFYDLSVPKFSSTLKGMVQREWSGRLYMDTCNGYAFASKLRGSISARFPNLQLFGCEGSTDMSVDFKKHRQVV